MKNLLVTFVIAIFAGCSVGSSVTNFVTGKDFNAEDIDNRINLNGSTKQEVYNEFGQPFEKKIDDAGETWIYMYSRSSGKAQAAAGSYSGISGYTASASSYIIEKNLTVSFDNSGIVRKYEYKVSDDPEKKASTPLTTKLGFELHSSGVIVRVEDKSLADEAGFRRGDKIIAVNDQDFGEIDFEATIKKAKFRREAVIIKIDRRGQRKEITITP
jgi:outer membrane protein assembly factor BamE (lipoprotein component of BamABCDE complex)